MKQFCFFLLISLTTSIVALSQQSNFQYNFNIDSITSLYDNQLKTNYDYILGKEYKPYHKYGGANPYLHSNHGFGSIYCNKNKYNVDFMYYDMFIDELIVNTNIPNTFIQIDKIKIDSFNIIINNHNYFFKKLQKSTNINKGFYELVYNDEFQLLIKHKSKIVETDGVTTYKHKQLVFLKKNNKYFNISSSRKFLSLFPKNSKQLKKVLKSLKINLKKPNHSQLIKLIQYAESL